APLWDSLVGPSSSGLHRLRRYTSPTETTGDLRRKPLFRSGPPAHFFFEKLLKLALKGEQVKTDEPAPIQAEVEERMAELEPEVEVLAVELLGGGRARILRIFLDRPGGVDLDLCARVTRHLRDLLRD